MSRLEFRVTPADNQRLARLCGQFDEHLKQIEKRLGVSISNRGDQFSVEGESNSADSAKALIDHLYNMTENESLAAGRSAPVPSGVWPGLDAGTLGSAAQQHHHQDS